MTRSTMCGRHQPLSERGAAAVEYALVIGLVSLVVIAGPVGLGINFLDYADALVADVADLLGV